MRNVVIFGTNDLAQLAHYYMLRDSMYSIPAFTVDEKNMRGDSFEGRPLVSWERLEKHYPPQDYDLFCPILDNKLREMKYQEGKDKGYRFVSYIHSSCEIASQVQENSFIMEKNVIQPFVKLESNLLMWTQNHIGHHSEIGHSVFMSSGVVIEGRCKVGNYSYLGANSTVKECIHLGEETILGMVSGACVDMEGRNAYSGIPARRIV